QKEILRLYKSSPELSILFELMTDFDEGLQEWRYRHIKLVERTIGAKHGTGGSPGVPFLKESLFRPIFHDLWAITHQMGAAFCAEELQQEVERFGVVHQRIDIKAGGRFIIRQIFSRFGFVIDRDEVRSNVKSMLDSADRSGKGAATMRERNAKFWEALKDSA